MQQSSDEQLMERVVKRDHDAFSALVDRHMRRVVSLAQHVIGVAAEADDVAQETFLTVWERARLFDPAKARFTTWLHRVTVNLCIDRKRTRGLEPLDCALELPADTPPLIEQLHTVNERASVVKALSALPIRHRTALVLFYMHELSQREAASVMGLSESAFESLLQRARVALGTALRRADVRMENRA